jgi:hypothetical protein
MYFYPVQPLRGNIWENYGSMSQPGALTLILLRRRTVQPHEVPSCPSFLPSLILEGHLSCGVCQTFLPLDCSIIFGTMDELQFV